MNANETNQIVELVERVHSWPAAMRIALARQILESLEGSQPMRKLPRGPSAAEVAAVLRTDKLAPDDVTVKEWIDEHRMEKYGK
jgi:hypothetical protein